MTGMTSVTVERDGAVAAVVLPGHGKQAVS